MNSLAFFIDTLGSGGAQRQLVNLAISFREIGLDVHVIYYNEGAFFEEYLLSKGVSVAKLQRKPFKIISTFTGLMKYLRQRKICTLIAFCTMPCFYSELARLFSLFSFSLIVSERNSSQHDKNFFVSTLFRIMHALSDYVTTNSRSHGQWLTEHFGLLYNPVVIYNGYPKPRKRLLINNSNLSTHRSDYYLAVGRIVHQKNGLKLIEALKLFVKCYGYCPSVKWAGVVEPNSASIVYHQEMIDLINSCPLIRNSWVWLGQVDDIHAYYSDARCLLHVSLYEGLPNAICEALMHGCPVIASDVCDNSHLVADGDRGFLCNPHSSYSIFSAIVKYEQLATEEMRVMSRNSQSFAFNNLTLDKLVDSYSKLIC